MTMEGYLKKSVLMTIPDDEVDRMTQFSTESTLREAQPGTLYSPTKNLEGTAPLAGNPLNDLLDRLKIIDPDLTPNLTPSDCPLYSGVCVCVVCVCGVCVWCMCVVCVWCVCVCMHACMYLYVYCADVRQY